MYFGVNVTGSIQQDNITFKYTNTKEAVCIIILEVIKMRKK
jgi:hypothetical protein